MKPEHEAQSPTTWVETELTHTDIRRLLQPAMGSAASAADLGAAARAAMVNRTHRVVRERAKTIQERRSKVRSLWVPTLVCSALLVILCTAVWAILDQYELEPTGVPDSSQQIFVLLLWFLPLSGALLAMVWFRRRERGEEEQS